MKHNLRPVMIWRFYFRPLSTRVRTTMTYMPTSGWPVYFWARSLHVHAHRSQAVYFWVRSARIHGRRLVYFRARSARVHAHQLQAGLLLGLLTGGPAAKRLVIDIHTIPIPHKCIIDIHTIPVSQNCITEIHTIWIPNNCIIAYRYIF